jgi:hypothetical protein
VNLDHFLLVADASTSGTRSAPWAKAGTSAQWDALVGAENDNAFVGWFDAGEVQLSSPNFTKASGAVLEAAVDLLCAWGEAPAAVNVAFVAYANPNGGALALQTPCGDGDGNLEAGEWITLESPLVSVEPPAGPSGLTLALRSPNPVHGRIEAIVELEREADLTVDLFDVRGRRVERLFEGRTSGTLALRTRGERGAFGAGVYFLVARSGGRIASRRIVALP